MIDLKIEREKKNMTQEQLASKVGIERQAISAFERGITKPNVQNAKKIAAVLSFDWSEFYNDEDNG